jgi:hypothetical protein
MVIFIDTIFRFGCIALDPEREREYGQGGEAVPQQLAEGEFEVLHRDEELEARDE